MRDLVDISPTLTEAAGAIVDDSFTRCFKSNPPEPWNLNIYLFPLLCLGVVVRYGILFPGRVLALTIGWIIFLSCYIPMHLLLTGHDKLRKRLKRALVELICSFFVASWTGVVKYHGPRPRGRTKQMLMGGGGSFSAGGPGKGMYSRLYIHSFSSFNSIYNNTAIFGIQAITLVQSSEFATNSIDVAAKELITVATNGVNQVQLDRAKQSTKSAILMNLESRMVASQDIGCFTRYWQTDIDIWREETSGVFLEGCG